MKRTGAGPADGYINEATFRSFDHVKSVESRDCPASSRGGRRHLVRMLRITSTRLGDQDKGYRGLGFQLLLRGETSISWGFGEPKIRERHDASHPGYGILMPPGDAGWIDGQLHTKNFTILSVEFPIDGEIRAAFGRSLTQDKPYRYVRDDEVIARLCAALRYEAGLGMPGGSQLARCLRHHLLALLSNEPGRCSTRDDALFLANLVKYVHECWQTPIHQDDISERARRGIVTADFMAREVVDSSRSSFYRSLRRQVPHLVFKSYVNAVRHSLVMPRILAGEDRLKEIARDVGYSASALTKLIRSVTDEPPSRWRRHQSPPS